MKKWNAWQWVRTGLAVVFVFVDVSLSMRLPYLMSIAIGEAVQNGVRADIHMLLVRMGLLSVGSVLAGFISAIFLSLAAQQFGQDLRNAFLAKVMDLPLVASQQYETGTLLTRMVGDTQILSQYLAFLIQSVWRPMLVLCFSLYHITILGGNLVAWLAGVTVLLVLLLFVMKRIAPWFKRIQVHFEKVNSIISRTLEGLRTIKVSNREETEEMRFARENNELLGLNLKIQSLMALVNPLLMLIVNLSVIAVLYTGSISLRSGDTSIGNVLAMIVYIQQMMMCAVSLGQVFEMTARAKISMMRICEVMEQDAAITGGDGNVPEGELTLQLQDTGFSYGGKEADPDKAVLRGLNAVFPAGSRIGIVGLTGAGKTTLCFLLSRFLDPTQGRVCLNGQDIRTLNLKQLHAKIELVPQTAELMPGTISENIRYGLENLSEEEIVAAARIAQADKYISAMERGYEETVLQAGHSLSGGQRQCIALARSLARRPKILILDDCCSAMDSATEKDFHDALKQAAPDMTVICVTSRLTDADWFDRMYVLNEGQIESEGTHRQLLKKSPLFRNIWETQLIQG